MSASNEDFLFAQEAQNLGYVTEAQVEEGFLLQKRMAEDLKIEERLAVILVKRGWLADEQMRRVRARIEPKGAGAQIEGYQLLARIGRGAMGTVYKARHLRLNRLVAIKVLRRDLAADPTQTERLRSEAEMLASLDHPHIVRALDAGESNGFPYFVMEYVEGENLRDRIAREGPLPEDDALEITRRLADALEKARRMGVVHRDVKPGNVLLTRQGVPKLMDLGLAKGPVDLGLTQHGATVGTPQFISPEQAQDPRKADTRSDIYSLGATLYAMLTGRPPFEGSTLAEIITKVLYEQPTPVRVLRAEVSGEASYLVERMMLKDPSLRYHTPAEVVADLDRMIGGRSIVPPGFTGNWEAWLLRRRMRVWGRRGALAAIALLVLGSGVFFWQQGEERRRAQAEADARAERILATTPWNEDDARPELGREGALDAHRRLQSLWQQRKERLDERIGQAAAQDHELEAWEAQARGPSRDRERVDAHRRQLALARAELDGLGALLRDLEAPLAAGEFGAAWTVLEVHGAVGLPGSGAWLRGAREALERVLREGGQRALDRAMLEAETALRAPASFEELARKAADLVAFLEDGRSVPPSAALETARREARRVGEALGRIAERAHELEQRGSSERARAALEIGRLAQHRADLADGVAALMALVDGQLASLSAVEGRRLDVPRAALLGPRGLVVQVARRVVANADQAVGLALDAELDRARTRLEAPGVPDVEGLRATAARLDALAGEAGASDTLRATEALTLASRLRKLVIDHDRTRAAAFEEALAAAFERVQAGDAEGLDDLVRNRLAERDPGLGEDPRIAELLAPVAPLRALEDAALARLAALAAEEPRRALDGVRLREGVAVPGGVPEQPVLRSVDVARRRLEVASGRGRSRAASVEWPIRALHAESLLAYARAVPGGVPPEVDAAARLSALGSIEDAPGVDLRPAVAAHERAARAYSALGDALPGSWARFVTSRRDRVVADQAAREQRAATAERDASRYLEEERLVEALETIQRLLDPGGRMRYTATYDERAQRVDRLLMQIRDGLEREGLRSLVPGAKVAALGDDVVEFRLDLDTPEVQKRNFLHGWGEFVRESAVEGVVTPGAASEPYALHLLAGTVGPVYDRPLSFAQMFDPARPFEFELTLHTLAGAPLIAFDMDGLKVAVASVDPRTAARRLPADLPPLDREKKSTPMEWDVYGYGRGVAFQGVPLTTFGSSWLEGWDWPDHAAAIHEPRWRDMDREVLASPDRRLFAFEPGRRYHVRVVRNVDSLALWVDQRLVAERREARWAEVGTGSDRVRTMRLGTGRISLLTWTPLLVDDIVLRGVVQTRWRAARTAALAAEAREARETAAAGEDRPAGGAGEDGAASGDPR
jgi:serine/threonine-protein kinase